MKGSRRSPRTVTAALAGAALVVAVLPVTAASPATTTAKVGGTCAKAGNKAKDARGRTLVCTVKNNKRVWQVAPTPTTKAKTPVSVTPTTTADTSALKKAPGFDGKTFKVGDITALSGPAAVIGKSLAAGLDTYWKYYNAEKGGIAGKYPVEVVLEDNLYESNTTVQKYNKIKDSVVMISQVMGTAPTLAMLPLLKADGMVASPASQDSIWVREQNLFPILEPYQIDVINAMDYLMTEGGAKGKTVCAAVQNDVYGEAGVEGLTFAAGKLGFDVKTVVKYKVGDQDVTGQVSDLRRAGCEVVFAGSLPTEFGKLLGTSAALGFAPQWVAQSPAWIDSLLQTQLRNYITARVLVAAVGPEWGDPTVRGAVEYVNRVKQYKPDQKPDYYFTFGYMQGMATAQVLENAVAMGDVSRAGIVKAMNSLDKLRFDGLAGDYGYGPPDKRNPSRVTTMFRANPDAPFGLRSLKYNFASRAARDFTIKADD